MDVRHARDERSLHAFGIGGRRECNVDGADFTVARDIDHDIARPTRGQQCIAGEEFHVRFLGCRCAALSGAVGYIMPWRSGP